MWSEILSRGLITLHAGFGDHETTEYAGKYVSRGVISLHVVQRPQVSEYVLTVTLVIILHVEFYKVFLGLRLQHLPL